MPGIAGDRTLALAMPVKALSPAWGKSVGGVSGEPTRVSRARRRDPSSSTCSSRNGERHPDSQDAVSLRGRAEERESWPVRRACRGLVPRQANAPATTDVQRKLRKGTTSARTLRSACTELENAETRLSRIGSTTRPSLGPLTRARRSPLQLRRGNPRRWRVRVGIAVG
jgi:hypothetical protein